MLERKARARADLRFEPLRQGNREAGRYQCAFAGAKLQSLLQRGRKVHTRGLIRRISGQLQPHRILQRFQRNADLFAIVILRHCDRVFCHGFSYAPLSCPQGARPPAFLSISASPRVCLET